jgi:hypothetical protein
MIDQTLKPTLQLKIQAFKICINYYDLCSIYFVDICKSKMNMFLLMLNVFENS